MTENENLENDQTILVVDDEALVALDLQGILAELSGLDVDFASSLNRGLELAESGRYDIAVLDWNLRGTTAETLAERLVAQGTRILFITSDQLSKETLDRFNALHLPKPFHPNEIEKALRSLS